MATTVPVEPARSRAPRMFRLGAKRSFSTLVLAGPGLGLYGILVGGSLVVAFVFSLTDWDGLSPTFHLVGLQNYLVNAPADPTVAYSFVITLIIAVTCTILTNAMAIPIAVLLNRAGIITRLFRTVIVYPITLSAVVVGIVWGSALSTNGVVSTVAQSLGLSPTYILAEGIQAVAAIAFVAVWHALALTIILYLAGLQTIPRELVDAARIDGAGGLRLFQYITLPMLAPTMTVNTILLLIWFMRLYDYILVMTTGGPITATHTVAYLLMSRAFQGFRYGYGSALAVMLLALTVCMAAVVLLIARRRVQL